MNAPRWTPVALAVAGLAGCAMEPVYTEPYALFTSEQQVATSGTGRDFTMNVDGTRIEGGDSVPVKPGVRTVQLQLSGGKVAPQVTVDAKPCTRYIMIARRSSPTDDDWTPEVYRAEPIGECRRKFGNY